MPVLFVGHGTPINALEDNQFTNTWKLLSKNI
jgi:4,5-DOPA dioxygenase extradiol